jgi:phenylacetate-CoA ligase
MMLDQGVTVDYEPQALVLSSEKLTAEMKSVLKSAFRARAYEEYGAVENCMLATECEKGSLHVSPDFGVIEIVDDEGRAVRPGTIGRVLCTSLLNNVQPLIRYEIGDLAMWSRDSCACGRDQLPVLKEVVGRLEDVVIGRDGRQMVRFHGIYLGLPNILEGQVIQKSLDQFCVRVVVRPEFGHREEEVIRRRFDERLGAVDVQIERVANLLRTDRGKFRAVICNLPPEIRSSTGNTN